MTVNMERLALEAKTLQQMFTDRSIRLHEFPAIARDNPNVADFHSDSGEVIMPDVILTSLTAPSLTVYYVGNEPADILGGLPFDCFESADEYRRDNGYEYVFSVTADIDLSSITVVES